MSFCQKSWAEGVKISLKIHMLLLLILPGKQRLLRVLWMCFPGKIHGKLEDTWSLFPVTFANFFLLCLELSFAALPWKKKTSSWIHLTDAFKADDFWVRAKCGACHTTLKKQPAPVVNHWIWIEWNPSKFSMNDSWCSWRLRLFWMAFTQKNGTNSRVIQYMSCWFMFEKTLWTLSTSPKPKVHAERVFFGTVDDEIFVPSCRGGVLGDVFTAQIHWEAQNGSVLPT